jgi:hypothetical protein
MEEDGVGWACSSVRVVLKMSSSARVVSKMSRRVSGWLVDVVPLPLMSSPNVNLLTTYHDNHPQYLRNRLQATRSR